MQILGSYRELEKVVFRLHISMTGAGGVLRFQVQYSWKFIYNNISVFMGVNQKDSYHKNVFYTVGVIIQYFFYTVLQGVLKTVIPTK